MARFVAVAAVLALVPLACSGGAEAVGMPDLPVATGGAAQPDAGEPDGDPLPTGGTGGGAPALTGGTVAPATGGTPEPTGGSVSTGGAPEPSAGGSCAWSCRTVTRLNGIAEPVEYVTTTAACSEVVTDSCSLTDAGAVHLLCGPGEDPPPETTPCPGDDQWSCPEFSQFPGDDGGTKSTPDVVPGPCTDLCRHVPPETSCSCSFVATPCAFVGELKCATMGDECGYQLCGTCELAQ
jgi:hypothetical protein